MNIKNGLTWKQKLLILIAMPLIIPYVGGKIISHFNTASGVISSERFCPAKDGNEALYEVDVLCNGDVRTISYTGDDAIKMNRRYHPNDTVTTYPWMGNCKIKESPEQEAKKDLEGSI